MYKFLKNRKTVLRQCWGSWRLTHSRSCLFTWRRQRRRGHSCSLVRNVRKSLKRWSVKERWKVIEIYCNSSWFQLDVPLSTRTAEEVTQRQVKFILASVDVCAGMTSVAKRTKHPPVTELLDHSSACYSFRKHLCEGNMAQSCTMSWPSIHSHCYSMRLCTACR